MSPTTKTRVKNWAAILAVLLPALGWALTTGASVVDTRYVHKSEYMTHMLVDSIQRTAITIKLDSANLRLQQIQCGRRIESGCR